MAVMEEIWSATSGVPLEVLVWVPEGGVSDEAWAADVVKVEQWAARVGARSVQDPGGAEAGRWGARASGAVAAYDGAGRLVASGGLTASRGHVSRSATAEAVARWLAGEPAAAGVANSPVFGCGW